MVDNKGILLETLIYRRRYDNIGSRGFYWKILVKDFFQRFVNKGDSVLDAPCGYGYYINAVQAKQKYGLDINPDCGKYLDKDVKFILGSITKIKLPNNSVNKIFVSNIFEHLTHPNIIRSLKEFSRVLKPKGKVMVLQPNIRFYVRDYWMFFDHITPIDDRALDEIFDIHGFNLETKYLKFLPHTTRTQWPFGEYFLKIYLKLPILWWLVGINSFIIYSKR